MVLRFALPLATCILVLAGRVTAAPEDGRTVIKYWEKWTGFEADAMRQIVERMDAQLGTHVSLETMAQIVGLSPGHFARKFQRSAGLSLNRFLNRRRIGASFAMLRDGSMPLARIALDLGFSSQSHFTRLFSGQTGITPHHYRRGDVYDRTPADSPFGRPE